MKDVTLKQRFAEIADEYLASFCRNYELEYDKDAWVGCDEGTIAMIGDFFVGFDDIRYCVDNNVAFDTWLEHYDYCLDAAELGLPLINLPSWCMGAPRASKEQVEHLRELHSDLAREADELSKSLMAQASGNKNETLF